MLYTIKFKHIALILSVGFLSVACATSPTGRSQLKLFPENQLASMGASAYEQLKRETPLDKNRLTNRYVKCVADSITAEIRTNGNWELSVFKDPAINAFALPGGKIGVYTGLLEVASNQDQLAAVIGHEIAHVLAGHGNERVSLQFATSTGLQLIQAMSGAESSSKSQLFGLLGLGVQVGVVLPYGRTQESEADVLGLRYMARAGFDPRQSTELWKNMARASGGQPPEFLSTHPSHATRINDLNANMKEALTLYRQAKAKGKVPACR